MTQPQPKRYLLNLFSSDVNGLTYEGENEDLDRVMQAYYRWTRIDLDFDEDGKPTAECAAEIEAERAAGMFSIEEQFGPRLAYKTNLMAIYKEIEGEEGLPDYKPILFEQFRSEAEAKTRIALAKKRFEEDLELDKRRYENDLRTSQIMSVKGISNAKPVPARELDHYYGDIECRLAKDSTIEELRAVRWPEPGYKGDSDERAFNVTSGQLRVTDPCYDGETWCAGNSDNVKNGRWLASVGYVIDDFDINSARKRFNEQVDKLEATAKKVGEVAPGLEPNEKAIFDRVLKMREERKEGKEDVEKAIAALTELRYDMSMDEICKVGDPMRHTGRVAFLRIRHEDTVAGLPDQFTKSGIDVGVDSGGAGFFDMAYFKKVGQLPDHGADKDKSHPHHTMYDAYGHAVCGPESWGVIEEGACFSSSGYGDGGYNLFERRDEDGLLIEARIVYLHEGNDGFVEQEDEE